MLLLTPSSTVIVLLVVTITIGLYRKTLIARGKHPLPPGPRPLPFVGNILDVPRKHLAREYADLSSKYGNIVYLQVFGHPIVLLGSYEVARELLTKRSNIYSDRPRSIMAEMTGLTQTLGFKHYGDEWRRERRVFHQVLRAEALPRYYPIQVKNTRRFLQKMLSSPEEFVEHLKFTFYASMMQVVYGLDLEDPRDEHYELLDSILDIAADVAIPGKYLVDVFPSLRFLPSRVRFEQFATKANRKVVSGMNIMFEAAVHEAGNTDSVVSTGLRVDSVQDEAQIAELNEVVKNVATSAYAAGSDSTLTSAHAFFLAMVMFPDVQKKAQAELDAVVGQDRLPDFSDRDALPYMNALIKEVFRWHAVAPIGLPHCTTADDEYNGYHIPAGTVIITNSAMARDPTKYPDPDTFSPERFLDTSGQPNLDRSDPADFAFGFGRRICPGMHFADAALFILCASVLHVFDIRPPKDEDGAPIDVERIEVTTDTLFLHLEAYNHTLTPRSVHAASLIEGIAVI